MMRPILLSVALAALVLFGPSAIAQAELVDKVVATVGKDVILFSDLLSQIGGPLDELRGTATSREDYQQKADQLVIDALENSIERLLMAREARKYPQLAVSDKEVDEALDRIRKGYTPEEFVELVAGAMSDYREWLRTQMVAMRMTAVRTQEFEREVVVADEEIDEYYESHRDEYQRPERVYVRQILLRVQTDEEREQARVKLELVRAEIANGADFAELAKVHSQAFGAEQGGAIGWQQEGDLVEPLNSAAFALAAGEVSEFLESPLGLHLLLVEQHEAASIASKADVALEIESILRKQAANEKYQTWLSDLRKRSQVRIFYR